MINGYSRVASHTMPARSRTSNAGGSVDGRLHHAVHHVDHIGHGAHRLEGFRLEVAAKQRLELHDQLDRVDAVDVQILAKPRFRAYPRRIDIESFVKDPSDALVE